MRVLLELLLFIAASSLAWRVFAQRKAKVSTPEPGPLEEAIRSLQLANERLRASEEAWSEVLANLSHELRTPLTLILGPVRGLLEGGQLNEPQRRSLSVVLRNARLMEKHVDEMLMLAKNESGEAALEPRYAEVDVAELLRSCCAHFESSVLDGGFELRQEIPDRLLAELDAEMFERIAFNLLSNALKFTPHGGLVVCRLNLDAASGTLRLQVADNGPGVAPELADSIFDRFRQGDPAASRMLGGFGLGLAIVRTFAEIHRGRVTLSKASEGGAQFDVFLPLRAPDSVALLDEPPIHVLPPITCDLPAPVLDASIEHKPLVLVVENSREMSAFLCDCLRSEWHVLPAFDGAEGLARIEALGREVDLVLTDVMMPQKNGAELVAAIRERPELSATPILILSAREDDALRAQLLRDGAQDYVTKPFSVDELRARVRNLVRNKQAHDLLSEEVETQKMDLVELARKVADHQHELMEALDTTQKAVAAAEEASRVKTNFLRMMSHELRTPIAAVQLQLELFQRESAHAGPLLQARTTLVERMKRSTGRLRDLIDSCLEYTRIDSGRMMPRKEMVDLAEIVREVVDEQAPYAHEKRLALAIEAQNMLPKIESDTSMLRLIVVNLVSNAVKYTEKGFVQVRIGQHGDAQFVEVTDSGPGIPQHKLPEVFEPFHQLQDIRREAGSGSGLGLWLVRDMVRALGARIELESALDLGSTFRVWLPATQPLHGGAWVGPNSASLARLDGG